jgi:CrcB protein
LAFLLVFAGGAVGTAARAALTLALPATRDMPYATWAINVAGSLLLGLLLGALANGGPGSNRTLRLALGTGLCGGFTTYSALALDGAHLVGDGLWGAGTLYALGTVLAGAIAAWVGIAAGAAASRRHAPARVTGAAR